jgi:hypothetical protein
MNEKSKMRISGDYRERERERESRGKREKLSLLVGLFISMSIAFVVAL